MPLGYLGYPDQTRATFLGAFDGRRLPSPATAPGTAAQGDGAPLVIELLGRASAVTNTGGEKVFAEEVEERLRHHPAIADLVVAPAADDRFGRSVAAVACSTLGVADLDELRSFGRGLLADYKLPRRSRRPSSAPRGNRTFVGLAGLEGPATVRSSP
ncbi:MAG: hypothetical protein R2704_03065 [Microthrixaceae bacterium]